MQHRAFKLTLSKGFTLIELLIVIAIIGILAGIVLASLGTARNKGADANVQSNVEGMRSQAALDNTANGCYSNNTTCGTGSDITGTCPAATDGTIFGDTTLQNQLASALKADGNGLTSCSLAADASSYAIAVQYKSDPGLAWCVDSSGVSEQVGTSGTPLTQVLLDGHVAKVGSAFKCQ